MRSVEVTLRDAPEIKRLIVAVFPGYKKHKAYVSGFDGGVNVNSYWDGGSRDEYGLVDIRTGRAGKLPTATHPYYDVARHGVEGENSLVSVDARGNVTLKALPDGVALVSAGTFCGKPATAHVYLPTPRAIGAGESMTALVAECAR